MKTTYLVYKQVDGVRQLVAATPRGMGCYYERKTGDCPWDSAGVL